MSEYSTVKSHRGLLMLKRFLYSVLKIIGILSAMAIWFLAGGVFHRSLDLFTRWPETAVNIASVTGGFLIMTASTIIVGYIIGERKNGNVTKKTGSIG